MMSLAKICLMVVFFVLLTNCLTRIDLEVPEGFEEGIVIDARLLWDSDSPFVAVTVEKLFNFTGESRDFVNVEFVKLIDDQGNEIMVPEVRPRNFVVILNPDETQIGDRYKIQVKIQNGDILESTFEEILPVPDFTMDLDTFKKTIPNLIGGIQNTDFLKFTVDTELVFPSSKDKIYLYWESIRNIDYLNTLAPEKNCIPNNSLIFNEVKVLDGSSLTGNRLVGFPIYERKIDFTIRDEFCLSVIQIALDQDGYDYWQAVGQNIIRNGAVLESPPGTLPTNFSNLDGPKDKIYGYFYASEQRIFTF